MTVIEPVQRVGVALLGVENIATRRGTQAKSLVVAVRTATFTHRYIRGITSLVHTQVLHEK